MASARLGPAPLQQLPQGLLGFFQLKSGGMTPTQLLETLTPVLDLVPWYLQTNSENVSGTASNALGPVGGSAGVVVPPNEWWYVHVFTVFTDVLLAGEEATITPLLVYPLSQSMDVGRAATSVGSAAGTIAVAPMEREPRWIPPGTQLGVRNCNPIGAYTNNLAARITRLRA